jgi:hypothetical protein
MNNFGLCYNKRNIGEGGDCMVRDPGGGGLGIADPGQGGSGGW